jgi:hypothetical protein
MDAAQVVETLMGLKISVTTKGDKLLLEPGSKVPPELLPDIRRCKLEILQLLTGDPPGCEGDAARVLAWAAHAAEVGLTLAEPVQFWETPLRQITTAEVGRYCRNHLKYISLARSSRAIGGRDRFPPQWWLEMEVRAIEAIAALKAAVDEARSQGGGIE